MKLEVKRLLNVVIKDTGHLVLGVRLRAKSVAENYGGRVRDQRARGDKQGHSSDGKREPKSLMFRNAG